MKYLFLFVAVMWSSSTTLAYNCLTTCSSACDVAPRLCNVWATYNSACRTYQAFCKSSCVKFCTCHNQCESDCIKLIPQCARGIPSPQDFACIAQENWCRSSFCSSKCFYENLYVQNNFSKLPNFPTSSTTNPDAINVLVKPNEKGMNRNAGPEEAKNPFSSNVDRGEVTTTNSPVESSNQTETAVDNTR